MKTIREKLLETLRSGIEWNETAFRCSNDDREYRRGTIDGLKIAAGIIRDTDFETED